MVTVLTHDQMTKRRADRSSHPFQLLLANAKDNYLRTHSALALSICWSFTSILLKLPSAHVQYVSLVYLLSAMVLTPDSFR
jgi:hypothetical protein